MKRTSILLADDHLDAAGRYGRLSWDRSLKFVGAACDGQTMLDLARQYRPEVVVSDIMMPQLTGIEAARQLREEGIETKIVFLTMYSDLPLVEEAFRTGAAGYVLKSGNMEELVKAIQCIARGGTYITPLLGDLISTLITAGPQQNFRGIFSPRVSVTSCGC